MRFTSPSGCSEAAQGAAERTLQATTDGGAAGTGEAGSPSGWRARPITDDADQSRDLRRVETPEPGQANEPEAYQWREPGRGDVNQPEGERSVARHQLARNDDAALVGGQRESHGRHALDDAAVERYARVLLPEPPLDTVAVRSTGRRRLRDQDVLLRRGHLVLLDDSKPSLLGVAEITTGFVFVFVRHPRWSAAHRPEHQNEAGDGEHRPRPQPWTAR